MDASPRPHRRHVDERELRGGGGPRARALRRLVRVLPALGRAPAATARSATPRAQLQRAAAHGLRRRLPAAHPPDRPHAPQGPNNALTAQPGEPGSPWAIGGAEGGHNAVHPELGTLDDFDRFVEAARGARARDRARLRHPVLAGPSRGCASTRSGSTSGPTAPSSTPRTRPRSTRTSTRQLRRRRRGRALAGAAARRRVLDRPGRAHFRVDNPHTKPLRLLGVADPRGADAHPDVVFLAEAFTRPKMMRALAKAGFTQSYTYFTWRNFKDELTEYLEELTQPPMAEYFRGNLWPNTPDILPRGAAARRAARLPDARRAGRHAVVGLRHLQRLRARARTRRSRRAPRSTWTRRSTS